MPLQHSVRVGRRISHLHRENFKCKNEFFPFFLYTCYFERCLVFKYYGRIERHTEGINSTHTFTLIQLNTYRYYLLPTHNLRVFEAVSRIRIRCFWASWSGYFHQQAKQIIITLNSRLLWLTGNSLFIFEDWWNSTYCQYGTVPVISTKNITVRSGSEHCFLVYFLPSDLWAPHSDSFPYYGGGVGWGWNADRVSITTLIVMSALPAANRAPLSSVSRQVTSAVNLERKNTYFVHSEVKANLINIPARQSYLARKKLWTIKDADLVS